MPFKTPGKTSQYIRSILPPERDERLQTIAAYADAHYIPVLLPETAALLRQLVRLSRPETVLEVGTAIGYSGHLILSAAPQAHLYTIEQSESCVQTAKSFFAQSGLSDRVTVYEGDSSEIVPLLSGTYDFIFLDGPKAQYGEYLPFLSRALTPGGVLLCDNVLFNGMVSGESEIRNKKGGLVKKLDLFLHALMRDETLLSSVLPVGDGVSLSIKR